MTVLAPPNAAHFDANQVPTIMGVVGSAGTADIRGTALPIPVGVREDSGALYVYNLGPAGSVSLGDTPGGTLNLVIRVGNIGTIESGTVTTTLALNTGTITTIVAGTQNTLGTVGVVNNIVKGTVTALESGTLTALAVGTVGGKAASGAAAVANPVQIAGTDAGGTIYSPLVTTGGILKVADTGGTLLAGTLTNLVSGTINAIAAGTITAGTLTNLVSGTVNALAAGTITAGTLTNLVSGTINALASGTTTGGTLGNLNYGTVNIDPTPIKITPLVFGTLGTAGGSFFGTLSAASGAGTKHYITGVSVIGQTGTADIRILAGTAIQGTGVLGAGIVVPGGGFVRDYNMPFATGTNSEITYHFVGAGSAFIHINYWKG